MKKFFKFGCLGIIGLFVLIIVAALAFGGTETTETAEKAPADSPAEAAPTAEEPKEEPAEEPAKEGVLTSEKYDQIKSGMTYEEVVAIIGSEGQVMSESGDKGTEFHTAMYEWETDGFMSAANIMFQNNKMMSKSQMGVSDTDSPEVSLETFNQLSNGMTIEEVEAIIGGKGEILSETGDPGTQFYTVMYSYPGTGFGSSVTLMFQGDKLDTKSQFGLE